MARSPANMSAGFSLTELTTTLWSLMRPHFKSPETSPFPCGIRHQVLQGTTKRF